MPRTAPLDTRQVTSSKLVADCATVREILAEFLAQARRLVVRQRSELLVPRQAGGESAGNSSLERRPRSARCRLSLPPPEPPPAGCHSPAPGLPLPAPGLPLPAPPAVFPFAPPVLPQATQSESDRARQTNLDFTSMICSIFPHEFPESKPQNDTTRCYVAAARIFLGEAEGWWVCGYFWPGRSHCHAERHARARAAKRKPANAWLGAISNVKVRSRWPMRRRARASARTSSAHARSAPLNLLARTMPRAAPA